jgi:hypothetical protein
MHVFKYADTGVAIPNNTIIDVGQVVRGASDWIVYSNLIFADDGGEPGNAGTFNLVIGVNPSGQYTSIDGKDCNFIERLGTPHYREDGELNNDLPYSTNEDNWGHSRFTAIGGPYPDRIWDLAFRVRCTSPTVPTGLWQCNFYYGQSGVDLRLYMRWEIVAAGGDTPGDGDPPGDGNPGYGPGGRPLWQPRAVGNTVRCGAIGGLM